MRNNVILQIQNLSKSFGAKDAIKAVNLDVIAGEQLAVVGPSGCGKTTLLRLIAGLEKPDGGSIQLDGRPLYNTAKPPTNLAPHQRQIAMVFQNYALWPHKSVFQNVAYPLQMSNAPKSELRSRVTAALKQVHMTGFEKRYPHQLSSGEQQRIALARALIMNPKLLLLDEPLSNLDAHLRDEMGYEIKRIQQEMNITVLHVTHDQNEAMKLANRISVMNQGQIIQTAPPREVYQQPADPFVAGFIGSSNLIDCPLLTVKGQKIICLPDGSTLALNHTNHNQKKTVKVAIRPEDISLANSGRGEPGVILDIAYQGNLLWYRISYAGVELKIQTTPKPTLQVGDPVWINIHRATALA
jgi:ABC-type Fe3+/spermidine/putrescine transport system ATPase subunit